MEQILVSGRTVTLVHLEHESRITCMPNMTEFHATMYHPNYQRTDDVRAVTCPQCKKTKVFEHLEGVLNAATQKRSTSGK